MIQTKIVSLTKFVSIIRKNKRKKIVFTNGCFDILHAGHVTYLEKAAKLGDILVVALNSDGSTRKLKGPGRPINPLVDRSKVIAALESVSYVISFEDETPARLIEKIVPNVLVKGGDYKPKDIVGYETVIRNGGKVKVIPFLTGRSTTKIIERAKVGSPDQSTKE